MYRNAKEFANITGLSYDMVRKMIKDGKIPAYRLYKRWMIPVEEALEAIKKADPVPNMVHSKDFLDGLKKI